MPKFAAMTSSYDCGATAVANLIAYLADSDAAPIRERIVGQPAWYPACDLWDSPTRLARILQRLTGQIVGTVPAADIMPCLALVKTGLLSWHWIAAFGLQPGQKLYWHDGRQAYIGPMPREWRVSCCLAVGSTGKWPWWWQLWGKLVDWI